MGTVMKTLNFDEDNLKEGLITLDKLKKLWKELYCYLLQSQ